MILSHQNKLTERQAQSRFAARDLSGAEGVSQAWHPAYGPSQLASFACVPSIVGGSPAYKPGARMLGTCLPSGTIAPFAALDTRANAKQEGTP